MPPFQGGAAGLFGYDLSRSLERLPSPNVDDFGVPALAVGFYDVVAAFDHVAGRAWLISQGFPEVESARRMRRARQRLDAMRERLAAPLPVALQKPPEVVAHRNAEVTSNFTEAAYLAVVRRAIDYIASGDIFQVNLAQRLSSPLREEPVSLYRRLRRCNAAPFAGYFDLGDFQILSASPERFLKVERGEVETRPIKGTRRRTGDPIADRRAELELLASEKDRAENVMIVDLMRNDLGRVCQIGSVQVGQLCGIESYEHVLHLVSSVRGRLRDDCTLVDLLRAAFPGGSITGAPKIRAMEIIAELEPHARGAYCGSLGYLGFDGSMDLSILIRTLTAGRGKLHFPVGGGIVADSVPEREYEETWHKAEGMLRAL